jgi:shikimate dehydrogenase
MNSDVLTLDDLRAWKPGEPRMRLAVLGDPVAHSLSPQMHNPALEACGIAARYGKIHVRPSEFREALRLLGSLGFIGVNCTIPHKFAALEAVDEVAAAARRLGAVNTVIFRADGSTEGRNSDGPGFLRTVSGEFGRSVRDLRILILGAGGGAGQAAAVQCAMEGCRSLLLANRTREKADQVAAGLAGLPGGDVVRVVPWESGALRGELDGVDLIVNGTSLGMTAGDPPLVPYDALRPGHLVYDMVYKPLETPLVAAARAAGAAAINGLPMLLWQGVQSFEWWFGREAPVDVMRAGLQAATGWR